MPGKLPCNGLKPEILNFILDHAAALLWSAVYIFFFIKSIFSFPGLTPTLIDPGEFGSESGRQTRQF